MMTYLVGDIGGTNARLALAKGKRIYRRQDFPSRKYKNFSTILKQYLKENKQKIKAACFAIAGPVEKQTVKATNLPWTVRASQLRKVLGKPVHLLNDFEANSYGVKQLNLKKVLTLNKGKQKGDTIAVLGPGTGLGQSFVIKMHGKDHIVASEGGHVDFAPQTKQETKLLEYLQRKYKRVSAERVLSGKGIEEIYSFLTGKQKKSKEITSAKDKSSQKTIELFSHALGTHAGNMALTLNATQGIYLAGGIAPSIFPKHKKQFMKGFTNKGRFRKVMREVPVKVVLTDELGLIGSAHYLEVKKNAK